MTIEKLPSGSYRATMMKNGKRYRITYEDKPSRKQAEQDLYEMISQASDAVNGTLTFEQASERYVDSKRNVLSPSTIRDYARYCSRMPEWFTRMKIDDITQMELNKLVNELSAERAPKTVYNYHGFVSAVLGTFRPSFKIYTTLPQKRKNKPYIPSDSQVKELLSQLEGTEFYIPFILGCYGMRRGEICALTVDDIEGDIVHINKSMAQNDKLEWVVKSTKTTESERDIIIPMEIADKIREQGHVYKGHPNSINKHITALEDKLGIQHFPLHKLRHYFASKMLTITDTKTVQALGGWKTDTVMKNIYAHSIKEEQERAKREAVSKLSSSIF